MGYSTCQVRIRYPLARSGRGHPLARSGWGTPPPGRTGVPPPGQVRMGNPLGTGYTWTGYAAGGTPLAVSRRRTVLLSYECDGVLSIFFYLTVECICWCTSSFKIKGRAVQI